MTKEQVGKFESLVNKNTSRDEAVKIVKSLLTKEDVKALGDDADIVAETLVDGMSWLGAFAPAPATFDIEAYSFTAGFGKSREQNILEVTTLEKIGFLKEDLSVKVGDPRRFSISEDLIEMLKNTDNGFLTED